MYSSPVLYPKINDYCLTGWCECGLHLTFSIVFILLNDIKTRIALSS